MSCRSTHAVRAFGVVEPVTLLGALPTHLSSQCFLQGKFKISKVKHRELATNPHLSRTRVQVEAQGPRFESHPLRTARRGSTKSGARRPLKALTIHLRWPSDTVLTLQGKKCPSRKASLTPMHPKSFAMMFSPGGNRLYHLVPITNMTEVEQKEEGQIMVSKETGQAKIVLRE